MARLKKDQKKSAPQSARGAPGFFSGLALCGLGVFLSLSFATADVSLDPNEAGASCATGLVGAWAAYFAVLTLGQFAAQLLALLTAAWGFHVLKGGGLLSSWGRVAGGLVMIFACSFLCDLAFGCADLPLRGLLARQLCPPAAAYLGAGGLLIVSAGVFFCGAVLAFGEAVFEALATLWRWTRAGAAAFASGCARLAGLALPRLAALCVTGADRAVIVAPRPRGRSASRPIVESDPDSEPARPSEAVEVEAAVVSDAKPAGPEVKPSVVPPEVSRAPQFTPYGEERDEDEDEDEGEEIPVVDVKPRKQPRTQTKAEKPGRIDEVRVEIPTENPDYQLPPLNMLDQSAASVANAGNVQKRAKTLEQTLAEFKIDGRVVQIERGPRVTLYEMTLAPGIRLTKVINLADNIAMALKAANVRIIAPIPGKDTIGIEIPNVEKDIVTMRDVVEQVNRDKRKQLIPVCLGKNVGGEPLIEDLSKMPHLLIAGATGSGKSVCINSVLLSFLMCCKPHELKTILIDPKVVELSRFRDIPHLMSPVITDMKKAVGVLEWACQEMDQRYEQLSMVGVNNLAKFNALGEAEIVKRLGEAYAEEELGLFPKHLPCIVIIIDELADLMLVAGKEVEVLITRLAAKSRAVGIHLILATQRPSVDVITGLIKANMPTRIAFQVASRVDSRTILDQNGAETLLGAGDMLYLPPGVGKVTRAQGVFVSDEELFRVVDFCRLQQAPKYHADLEGPVIGGAGKIEAEDFDELFVESGLAIIESGRGSVSLLQRKLGIGYGRASRIIDQLASVGVLGPFREGKAREILMTGEEFLAKFNKGQSTLPFGEADGEGLAGLREDERGPDSAPWDDDEEEG